MKNFYADSRPCFRTWVLPAIIILVQVLFFQVSVMGQAILTHNSATHFLKGTHNHTLISGSTVQAPYKATGTGAVWTSTNALPRKVQHHEACIWNNFAYFTGGLDVTNVVQGAETRRISPKVYRAAISSGLSSYTDLPDLPVGVMHHASLVANGHLFVIGGILNDSTVSNRIYHAKLRADGSLSQWILNPDTLPVPLWGHTASFVNGSIIITGGSSTTDTTALNTAYTSMVSPAGNIINISPLPPMSSKRNQHAAAVFGNVIYIAGGFNELGVITASVVYGVVDMYGGVTGWQTATSLPEPLYGLTASADQGRLVVSGGYNDNLGFSVQYSYSADLSNGPTFTWSPSTLYYTHYANAASFIHQGKLYITGGLDIFNATMNQAYYNTLTASTTQKMAQGVFTGDVFDLGVNRQVDSLSYAVTNYGNTAFYYRTAQHQGNWSNWNYVSGIQNVVLSASLRYVQYMFHLNDTSTTNTTQITSVSLRFAAIQLAGSYTAATWTFANSPYWVTADVFIDGNVTLEAGTILTFGEGTRMEVRNGTLTCNGNIQLPVTLTSFSGDDGYWNGLHFTAQSLNKNSVLNYTIIENAGFQGHANLNCTGTNQPTINQGILRNGSNSAVFCNNAWPMFNGVTLQNHQNYLVRLQNGSGPVFNNATLTANALEKVLVTGGTMSNDAYWDNICPEYHVTTSLAIQNKTLTIEKGIRILFATGTGFNTSNGRILAEGINHPDSMIYFGAINGTAGGWTGVLLTSTNTSGSRFKHCHFSQGANYNLKLSGVNFYVDSCSFSGSTGYGMQFDGSQITVKNSVFQQNQTLGAYSNSTTNYDILFDSCRFIQNGTHGFEGSGTVVVKNSLASGNAQTGIVFTGSSSGTRYEPQIEKIVTQNNGGNGLTVSNSFIDIIDVQVLNNAGNGFEMNANVSPAYYNLTLAGNLTNDFRIQGGSINRDITWKSGQYPFVVIGAFEIRDNSQLTLEKGFTLRFADNAKISIGTSPGGPLGRINAVGTSHPDSLITFTALNGLAGGWKGLEFGSYTGNCLLKHCVIEKGTRNLYFSSTGNNVIFDSCLIINASGAGVEGNNTQFILNNSIISNNIGNGVDCSGGFQVTGSKIFQNGGHGFQGGGSCNLLTSEVYGNGGSGIRLVSYSQTNEPQIEDVVVSANGTNGIWASNCSPDLINVMVQNHPGHGFLMNANVEPEYYNLIMQGNNTNDFRVQGGDVERNITWKRGIYPFVVIESFSTRNDSKLTIEPGMTIRFAQNCSMNIGGLLSYTPGRLSAVGISHPDSMIRFTSLNGEPGGWNGITFALYARNSELTNCIVEHAVDNITLSSSSNYVTINGCIIRGASNRGIFSTNSTFTLRNSMIVNNNGYGIHLAGSAVPVLGDTSGMGNDIFNNQQFNIYNASTSNVFARFNFFNTTDSLTIAQRIYDKSENTSYGTVFFHPYTTTSNFPFGQFISCRVRYNNADSTLMNNTWIKLRDGVSNVIQQSKTTSDGFATFTMLPDGLYSLDAEVSKPWGGVNSTDALVILQHFSTITTLTGLRYWAADVNMSQSINATDALNVLQRFAKVTNSFQAGDWMYDVQLMSILGAPLNTTLWTLCVGDVNGSYIPGSSKAGNGDVTLSPEGTFIAQSSEVEIPVFLKTPQIPVAAVSLSLRFPADSISIEKVSFNNTTVQPVYYVAQDILHIAWCNLVPVNPQSGQPLLTITVSVRDQSVFKNSSWFTLTGNNELADPMAMVIPDAELTYPVPVKFTGTEHLDETAWIATVAPNPATETVTLSVVMPSEGMLEYALFSTTGSLIRKSEPVQCHEGIHHEPINTRALSPGMYLLKVLVDSSEGQMTRILRIHIL